MAGPVQMVRKRDLATHRPVQQGKAVRDDDRLLLTVRRVVGWRCDRWRRLALAARTAPPPPVRRQHLPSYGLAGQAAVPGKFGLRYVWRRLDDLGVELLVHARRPDGSAALRVQALITSALPDGVRRLGAGVSDVAIWPTTAPEGATTDEGDGISSSPSAALHRGEGHADCGSGDGSHDADSQSGDFAEFRYGGEGGDACDGVYASGYPAPPSALPSSATYRYVVMSLIEGETLGDWLAEQPTATASQRIRALRTIATALDYMHSGESTNVPVAHGDVKPENIIRRADGSTVLVDLGLVRLTATAGRPAGRGRTPPPNCSRGEPWRRPSPTGSRSSRPWSTRCWGRRRRRSIPSALAPRSRFPRTVRSTCNDRAQLRRRPWREAVGARPEESRVVAMIWLASVGE